LDEEAKREFLTAIEKTHGRQLRRYLAARTSTLADVQDLTQEVYLRLLRVENHDAIRNPQAYLYTIASHVLYQHRLTRAAAPPWDETMDAAEEIRSAPDTDPARQVEAEQRFEQLGRALLQYSPRAYATLVMHRCDGVPLSEIAEKLGVSYTMVKRYLAKALLYCEQQLQEMK